MKYDFERCITLVSGVYARDRDMDGAEGSVGTRPVGVLSNVDADRGWPATATRIVDLWTLRDDGEDVHFGAQRDPI